MQCLFYRLCLQSFHLVERKKNEIQHKKKRKKSLRGSDRLKSAPPLIAGVWNYTRLVLSLSLLIHNWRCIIKLTRLPVCQICNFCHKEKISGHHHHHQPVRQWSGIITMIELRNIVDRNRRVTSARPGVCVGRYVAFLSLSLSYFSDGPTRKFYKPIDSQRDI